MAVASNLALFSLYTRAASRFPLPQALSGSGSDNKEEMLNKTLPIDNAGDQLSPKISKEQQQTIPFKYSPSNFN